MSMLSLVLRGATIPQAIQVMTQQGYRETLTPPGSHALHLSTPQQWLHLPYCLVLSTYISLMAWAYAVQLQVARQRLEEGDPAEVYTYPESPKPSMKPGRDTYTDTGTTWSYVSRCHSSDITVPCHPPSSTGSSSHAHRQQQPALQLTPFLVLGLQLV